MTDKAKSEGASRRDFLKMAATGAPAAVAAVAVGTTQAEAASATPTTGETKLQDTAQTRAYYASARF